MTDAASARPPAHPLTTLLGSDRFAHAFTMTAFLVVCCRTVIERTAGIATYVTMVAVLSVLAVAVLLAHRRVISLPRLTTPLAVGFVGWAALSLLWNTDPQAGLVSAVSIVAIALVGVAIANTRDTLEVVHALANVARIVLVLSLALELLAGVFLDHPIDILGIQGNIASLGPIQGIFGTRNALGFTAVMAIVTFVIEWRANTVSPWLSLGSVLLAGALALLTGSPIVLVVAIAGAVATSVLLMVRHTRAPYRSAVQWTLGAAVLASIVLAYLLRQRLITLIGADNDINARYDLWLTVLRFVRSHPFRGWGWFGPWIPGDMPFSAINASLGTTNLSALNAFFDALLQLGWIGFVLFFALCATAFVRSWIDASNRRSVVYAWTPLVLVALIVYSCFESFALSGFGWLLLVVCATRAYEHQSLWEWRGRLGRM